MLIAAFVFLYLSYNAKKNTELLQSDGTVIEGSVTEKRISYSEKYENKYYVSYRYIFNDNEYSNENRVFCEFWNSLEANEKIPVRVLRSEPDNSVINSPYIFPESTDYSLIAFALFFTCLMFTVIPYYKPLKKYLEERRKPID